MTGPTFPPYNVGDLGRGIKRKAPAAERNVLPIGDVLSDWLPASGLVLEIASGTGEHALAFSRRFPRLDWQPSDPDPDALRSISAWAAEGPSNLRPPLPLDVTSGAWPVENAAAILCVNMVHIAPWEASLGLLEGASKVLGEGCPLILYGPWLQAEVPTAPSNQAFDISLRDRDSRWGLRLVEDFETAANERHFRLEERRPMPSNNLMLLFRR